MMSLSCNHQHESAEQPATIGEVYDFVDAVKEGRYTVMQAWDIWRYTAGIDACLKDIVDGRLDEKWERPLTSLRKVIEVSTFLDPRSMEAKRYFLLAKATRRRLQELID